MEIRSIVEQSDGGSGGAAEVDALRARLHGMWADVAGGWAEHAGYVDSRGAEVTERMLALSRPRPGERVLELACGPGSVGLAAAERVGPDGEVVVSDVAAEMTAIAVDRAAALGLTNVTGRALDIERIDEPDASYDVVLCREGLMFAPDPARGAREIVRVLRGGGRAALAVWGPRERNPWLGVVFDTVSAQLGQPIPPPAMPGPFSLADADALAALLTGAGLSDVTVSELPVPLRAASFEEWWARTCALAGPLAKILASLPEDAAEALRARAREAARPYETADGLAFSGLTLLASGRRASTGAMTDGDATKQAQRRRKQMSKTTLPAAAPVAGIKTLTTAIAGLGLVTGMLIGLLWTGSAQGVARHDVSMRWEVAFSDIGGSSNPNVVDVFLTRGAPFGRGRVVTETPREQSSEPIRTPEFVIKTRRGRVRGRLRVEKTYLETTATHQLAKFEGTGRFDGGTRRYGNATGKVTRVWGKVDCFADGACDGHLRLTGWVRY